MAIVICGFPRSGSTLLYLMLRATVRNYEFYDNETASHPLHEEVITKRPLDVFRVISHKRIITLRDPRSVITSIHEEYNGYFIGAKECITGTPGLVAYYEAQKELIGYQLKYEDLVSHPDKIQKELGRYFRFEYKGKFSNFYKHTIPQALICPLNGVRKIDNGHDWKNHIPRIIDEFSVYPELFQIIRELGYEKDDSWYEDCIQENGCDFIPASV